MLNPVYRIPNNSNSLPIIRSDGFEKVIGYITFTCTEKERIEFIDRLKSMDTGIMFQDSMAKTKVSK